MKKLLLLLFCLLQLASLAIPVSAESGYSWYCAHAPNGERPPVHRDLAFIEEYDAYYLSHKDEKVIYLTFDAGYENGNVAKVLDILRDEKVPAAFFVLPHLVRKEPELVKRMSEEGHIVGNHSVHHTDMSKLSDAEFLEELRGMEAVYREITGETLSRYYRPPEGRFSRENLITAQKNGYKTVFWSFAYPDWSRDRQMPADQAKAIVLNNLHNGEIMLLHPTSSTNAAILRDVIREARARGYRFGSLDEL